MRLSISISAALIAFTSLVSASKVVDLDNNNFDQIVGQNKGALVEFFAPWCGHCKNLAPTYELLADAFPSDKVIIAKTDADGVGRELGSRFGVSGFPTLKWFPAGSLEPIPYSGARDLETLAAFVTKQSGVKSNIKPPPPPAYTELDVSNFDEVVLNESKNVLVAFTAPWCGHCKNMKPAYEKVAKIFSSEPDVVIALMDADDAENKPVAQRYGVSSFPTIKFFPKGSKEPVAYDSGRTAEQFVNWINEKSGTHRSVSGLLSETAGRVLTLDTLASEFFSANVPERPEIVKKAQEAVTTLDGKSKTTADYYVKAMERIIAKGEEWLTKEQTRLASLLASPSLAPTKLDELKVKINILSAFASKKASEAYDSAEEVLEGAWDSAKQIPIQAKDGLDQFADAVEEKAKRVRSDL
ncbi:protein disulfide-isomerase domain [Cryptococcus neoformans]|nr:protein disulfide-isomerase domain [Cryptococcus neoformans var. grubii]